MIRVCFSLLTFALLTSLIVDLPSFSGDRETAKVQLATAALREITKIPEKTIPPSLLKNAYGIAVIPEIFKVGFVLGGQRGIGILTIKQVNGNWSYPTFISLTSGSIGYQGGAQLSDAILVFKTPKSIKSIRDGKFTLGADASIAAGPVGRKATAATDLKLDAEIYSYSRSKGLFAGVSLEGASLKIDSKSNERYYKNKYVSTNQILSSKAVRLPNSGKQFLNEIYKRVDH
ncbi:MAG: lipid-binding SYLF domain-containing protein [Candidatus Caenarcaniphilales bacterium]|nr:lipid-binding SYLF domain-containing protein [Candidatus Caenarcaniphilales bacterium]